MDIHNHVVRLCMEGSEAEFRKDMNEACRCYSKAWLERKNDFEACVAAHYLARCQKDPEGIFHWNRTALEAARASDQETVKEFYPSLYVNMGRSYELLGDHANAEKYYSLAEDLGLLHRADEND